MGTKLQVVAAMAVVGSVAGGGVALAHVPAVQQTAATASQPSDSSGQTLQSLLDQSAKLHAEIDDARQALAQASADAVAPPQSSTTSDLSVSEPSEEPQNTPAQSTPAAASTAPAVNAPATPFAGDDGREAGDHEGGDEGQEAHSTRSGDSPPSSTGTRAPGGGDD